ncbi:MAG TPA: hypothetical protein VJY54_03930 [Lachnospiraceae bacterium]|nr:hypothetical protein [Lachnospiraceae bacterium]
MYNWVTDKEFLKQSYSECSDIVNHLVQHLKKYGIGANMSVVGSKLRKMVTQNDKQPIDFDFNLVITEAEDINNGRKLKETIRIAFNEVLKANGWRDCEDSRSALTTKQRVLKQGNKTAYSIDICIVKVGYGGELHRLIHDKTGNSWMDQYYWNLAPNSGDLRKKEEFLKPDYWIDVRETYLEKKNYYLRQNDHNHPSFICYIEAINEVYYKVKLQGIFIN